MSGDPARTALDEDALLAWSAAWGLGHSRDRIAELLPGVNEQVADLAALWGIDVAGHEPIPSPPRWREGR